MKGLNNVSLLDMKLSKKGKVTSWKNIKNFKFKFGFSSNRENRRNASSPMKNCTFRFNLHFSSILIRTPTFPLKEKAERDHGRSDDNLI